MTYLVYTYNADKKRYINSAICSTHKQALDYCKYCTEKSDSLHPVMVNVKNNIIADDDTWKAIEDEVNKRHLESAIIQEFLRTAIPPFEAPFSMDDSKISQDF